MAQSAIDLLTLDPCRLHSIAQAAHNAWQQRFTLDRYQRQILQAIESSSKQEANQAADKR
jgi:hypothetical protein